MQPTTNSKENGQKIPTLYKLGFPDDPQTYEKGLSHTGNRENSNKKHSEIKVKQKLIRSSVGGATRVQIHTWANLNWCRHHENQYGIVPQHWTLLREQGFHFQVHKQQKGTCSFTGGRPKPKQSHVLNSSLYKPMMVSPYNGTFHRHEKKWDEHGLSLNKERTYSNMDSVFSQM